jgi:molybdopterin converting factor subunit 1
MIVNVLLFAIAKDIFGKPKLEIELPANATVADLKLELLKLAPTAEDLLARCVCSVDQQYATDDTRLKSDQEIALIPPVSGG